MQSISLEEAQKKLQNFNNRTLINFIAQRQCQKNPSDLLKFAYELANERRSKELAMIWKGKKLKDEPIERIIEEFEKGEL